MSSGAFRAVSGVVVIVLAVALTFNLSDIIQRDIPNYFEAAGNSLEKGAGTAPAGGGSVSLQDCQTAAMYGGSGLEKCGPAPAFTGIQQWLNTPGGKPVSLASLKGKVVLVDFWAYSCVNCQRELPRTPGSPCRGRPISPTPLPKTPRRRRRPTSARSATIKLSPGLQAYSFTFG